MSATGESGFTLLEMMVTLAIMALIAGIGFPALSRAIDHFNFIRAVNETGSALRSVRAAAIMSETPMPLILGADGRWLAGNRALGAPLPSAMQVTITPAPIAFFADGTARPADIRVSDGREERRFHVEASGLVS